MKDPPKTRSISGHMHVNSTTIGNLNGAGALDGYGQGDGTHHSGESTV